MLTFLFGTDILLYHGRQMGGLRLSSPTHKTTREKDKKINTPYGAGVPCGTQLCEWRPGYRSGGPPQPPFPECRTFL